jgi:hypothetical protein
MEVLFRPWLCAPAFRLVCPCMSREGTFMKFKVILCYPKKNPLKQSVYLERLLGTGAHNDFLRIMTGTGAHNTFLRFHVTHSWNPGHHQPTINPSPTRKPPPTQQPTTQQPTAQPSRPRKKTGSSWDGPVKREASIHLVRLRNTPARIKRAPRGHRFGPVKSL